MSINIYNYQTREELDALVLDGSNESTRQLNVRAQLLYCCALVRRRQLPTRSCSHPKVLKQLLGSLQRTCMLWPFCQVCITHFTHTLFTSGCAAVQWLSTVATEQKGFRFETSGVLGAFFCRVCMFPVHWRANEVGNANCPSV